MARSSNFRTTERLLAAATPQARADLPHDPHDHAASAGRLLGTVFQSLGPVIGAAGVRATFARSLKLKATTTPSLGAMLTASSERQHTEAELAELLVQGLRSLAPAAARSAAVELFTTFFDIMSNFIGEDLLWRIVQRPPPELDDTGFEETD